MPKNLLIEIEAKDDQDINTLLKHIFGEVTDNKSYKDKGIECQSTLNGGWIETNKLGKYRWEKAYGRNYSQTTEEDGKGI